MPIIDPNIIYKIYLLSKIHDVSEVLTFFSFIALAGAIWFSRMFEIDNDATEKDLASLKRWFFVALTAFFIFGSISVVVPNKETLIAMTVAKEVTYERVEKAAGVAGGIRSTIKADIIDIINSTKEVETKKSE